MSSTRQAVSFCSRILPGYGMAPGAASYTGPSIPALRVRHGGYLSLHVVCEGAVPGTPPTDGPVGNLLLLASLDGVRFAEYGPSAFYGAVEPVRPKGDNALIDHVVVIPSVPGGLIKVVFAPTSATAGRSGASFLSIHASAW